MTPAWNNPMLKVKAPNVFLDPLEPISIEVTRVLINTHQRGSLLVSGWCYLPVAALKN